MFLWVFPLSAFELKPPWQRILYVDRRQKDETIWFRSFSLPFPLFKIFFYSLARSEPFYELSIFPVLWQFVTRVVCHYNAWYFFSSACYFFPMRCAATVFDTFWVQKKNLWLYRVCLICLATKVLLVCVFWFCYV